jgi:GT2 family glycosyltransferase
MGASTASREAGKPFVDVVVCTYSPHRMEWLEATLKSLESQTYRPFGVLLVVDHNPELASQLRANISNHVRVAESVGPRGLSGARNSGIEQSEAEIIAFIDDDAAADPSWIERLVQRYHDDGVLAAGGKIAPVWDGGCKPRWLPEEFLWTIGCTYRGMSDRGSIRNTIGCNMSFRSLVFEKVGRFNPDVGRLGGQPLGCEETELCIRAQKYWPERQIVYVPDAIVYHHVPRARQTLGYFLRRCYAEGVSKARVRRLAGASSLGVESRYVTHTLAPAVLRNSAKAVSLRDPVSSLGQAGAICVGLLATTLGFLVGTGRDILMAALARRSGGEHSGATY